MSTVKVNTIDKRTGSTLTLGGSGTAVTLACGATQTGFGRTGTVDWCTTAKTSPFTAVSGDGFFVNTAGGAVTVTLPGSPSAGDIIALKDYANTWDTNAVTLCRNSSKINGECSNTSLNTESQSVTLIYVDGTKGWQDIQDSTSNVTGASYINATGGTITTSGNFKIHTFNSSSNFVVNSVGNSAGGSNTISYLTIAGGGAGARSAGGGGGAGGFREGKSSSDPYTASPLATTGSTVSAQTYPITVGAGGATQSCPAQGGSGANSVFSTITAAGGGGGNMNAPPGPGTGAAGGSGGGGGHGGSVPAPARPGVGGAGNTPPVSPPQGQPGGNGVNADNTGSGGGGGATAAGVVGGPAPSPASCGKGGPGGAGATTVISGSPVGYAGGGGGGSGNRPDNATATDGGAAGGRGPATPAGTATANRGGGGGGGGYNCAANGQSTGGSGVVVIRYKYQN